MNLFMTLRTNPGHQQSLGIIPVVPVKLVLGSAVLTDFSPLYLTCFNRTKQCSVCPNFFRIFFLPSVIAFAMCFRMLFIVSLNGFSNFFRIRFLPLTSFFTKFVRISFSIILLVLSRFLAGLLKIRSIAFFLHPQMALSASCICRGIKEGFFTCSTTVFTFSHQPTNIKTKKLQGIYSCATKT